MMNVNRNEAMKFQFDGEAKTKKGEKKAWHAQVGGLMITIWHNRVLF